MDIEKAKNSIDLQFEKAIYSDVVLDNFHPVRVTQALKSLIGIDIDNPSRLLIEWGNEYLNSINKLPQNYYSYSIKKSKETIVLSDIGKYILSEDYDKCVEELQDLCTVSDGNQIFEYLIEFSCHYNKSAIPFIWSASRTNIFLKNKYTYHLLLMSIKVLLDNKLKKKALIGRFEQSCIFESIKRGVLTRQDKINKYLVGTSLNFDSNIDFFEFPIDVIGKGRIAILDYLNSLNTECITKEMVLFLDGCRMVLKDSPKEDHLRIMEILNQVIERKLYIEKNW